MLRAALRSTSRVKVPNSFVKMSTSTSNIPEALVLSVGPKDVPKVPPSCSTTLDVGSLWVSSRAKSDKALETRVFHQQNGPTVTLVATGKEVSSENARREQIRKAYATGVKATRDAGAQSIGIVASATQDHDAGSLCLSWPAMILRS